MRMLHAIAFLFIMGHAMAADAQNNAASLFSDGKKIDFQGFECRQIQVDGCDVNIVLPREAAQGRPWIWRAEFFGAFPQLDVALLQRGFFLVYIKVGNTFGCPSALKHCDVLYTELTTKHGFSRKPVLEGLSRGGLYIYNWAATHTDCVGCLVGDAPVCDFKSWPGGKGKGKGSAGDWQKLIKDYEFKSEAEALAYGKNPIDNLEPLAKARIPIIHVYGDADDIVPWDENTKLIAERYNKLGGMIELINKPGVKHHPHGLQDPTPMVEFILKHSLK